MYAYCCNNPILFSDSLGYRCVAAHGKDMMGTYPTPYEVVADGTIDMYIVDNGKALELISYLGDTKDYIVAEDKRDIPGNPNIKIHNSYLIDNSQYQREVLSILLEYNEDHPATQAWTRELDEMEDEWDYHNQLASWNFAFDRTAHVDLDEQDKGKKVIQKGFEFIWEKISS